VGLSFLSSPSYLLANNNWTAFDYKDSFPNVKEEDIIKIPGTSHAVHGEAREQTVEELKKFFDRQEKNLPK